MLPLLLMLKSLAPALAPKDKDDDDDEGGSGGKANDNAERVRRMI